MILMEGTKLAAARKAELAEKVKALPRRPGLAVILVGDDPASRSYVTGKRKDCAQCDFYSEEYVLPAETTAENILSLIDVLNERENIDGILLQLPLPKHLDHRPIVERIRPDKDVDGLHPMNLGRLLLGDPTGFVSCTPLGILELLKEYNVPMDGKDCVILGRSNIVGRPLNPLLIDQNVTVTTCHTATRDLAKKIATADIVVSAVGKRNFLTGDMIKPGACVIDVSINRDDNGKLHGDSDETVAARAGYFTPVPGGVGPMTRCALMLNTYRSACQHLGLSPD